MALYNIKLKRESNFIDCLSCEKWDTKLKRCDGINKICFLYDKKTKTVIDGITHLPLKIEEQGE